MGALGSCIFYGPPGTGKTYIMYWFARELAIKKNKKIVTII